VGEAQELARHRRVALHSVSATLILVGSIHAMAWLMPMPPPPESFAIVVVFLCLAAALAGRAAFAIDEIVKVRRPRLRWAVRLVPMLVFAAYNLFGTNAVISRNSFPIPASLLAIVLLYGASLSAILASLLEWIEMAVARVRSLRTRLVLLGLIAAGATIVLYVVFTQIIRSDSGRMLALVWSLQLGLTGFVIWGVARVLARPMASTLEELSHAVHEVSRGNLDVRVPEQGKDELAELARALKQMIADLRRYVTPSVLFALRRQREQQISSERREVTVLFCDVRGFTALSETMPAEDVLRMLDFLFEQMIEIVEARDGYINRFTGDGMMIVFGAPMERANHAQAAIDCAIAMQARMRELNDAGRFGPGRVDIGVGVNTGPVVAGAVGNESREEYTVIGDCVNVASRLCSSAAGGEILIGGATAAVSSTTAEPMPPMSVKGKSAPLDVFRVASLRSA
jgi:class 3 adenylate cyclase